MTVTLRKGEEKVETRVVIRNNLSDQTIELIVKDLQPEDLRFLDEVGDRVRLDTGHEITITAVEGLM